MWNRANHSDSWPPEKHLAFLKACEAYIAELQQAGQLVAAQPLARSGVNLTKQGGDFAQVPLIVTPDVQVGYYHVRATSFADAIAIAKRNPKFSFSERHVSK